MKGETKRLLLACLGLTVLSLVAPHSVRAQSATTGAIAGVARDATAAVLPGVTVEAASPALIEKLRTTVTDDQGRYNIVDLRPGTYTVTFSLSGFALFRREGIVLTGGFTATANAEMKVGGLEETVTVTGASPVVDVRNVRTQTVISREMIDAVPTGKTIQGFATLTLGATTTGVQPGSVDVGGNMGESASSISIHGSRGNDMRTKDEGLSYALPAMGGQMRVFMRNEVGIQEVVLQTGGIDAESEAGGIQLNAVPRDGGNVFTVHGNAIFTNGTLQGSNLDDALRARGVTTGPSTKKIYDYGLGVGGPLKRDSVWFYSANRWWDSQQNVAGSFYNANTAFVGAAGSGVRLYTPDTSRPGFISHPTKDYGVRLTWQAAARHKIAFADNVQIACNCIYTISGTVMPEASVEQHYGPHHFLRTSWSHPRTNRLLLEAAAGFGFFDLEGRRAPGVQPTDIGITDLATGRLYNAQSAPSATSSPGSNEWRNYNGHVTASYVTGSHAFKTGLIIERGLQSIAGDVNQEIAYTFRGAVPVSLTQYAAPTLEREHLGVNAVFAQDQWKIGHVTLNGGLRFDQFYQNTLDGQLPASRFVGPRVFAPVESVPNWRDIDPRFGASYDVFGNGKTAVKASMGRYLQVFTTGSIGIVHPQNKLVTNATRSWADANGNYIPDCDLQSVAANGECDALSNRLFGTTVSNTTLDPDWLNGWAKRPYNWQGSVALQHELRSNVGLTVGYFRTWYGNFTVTQNRAVTADDFTPYCVTAPSDSRLPGGGGNAVCGFYDVTPAKFGQVNNFVTLDSNFGSGQTEVFNGIDVGINARFGKGGLLAGGVSTGNVVTDTCYQKARPDLAAIGAQAGVTAPRIDEFCHLSSPWSAKTQFKLNGAYPLPWDLQFSWALQSLAGTSAPTDTGSNSNVTAVYTNAQIAPSLGRNLAAGANGTATLGVVPPWTLFEDRLTQIDVRFAKIIRVGKSRVRGMVDLYNLTNANTVRNVNTRFGPAFLTPVELMPARLVKFGAQVDF